MPFYTRGPIQKRHGAYLPHWTAEGATYSVTFRLCDSLPKPVLQAYYDARERLLGGLREQQQYGEAATATFSVGDAYALRELFTEKIERQLDKGLGDCWMNRPEIADLVQNAVLHFNGARYQLHAWCVMPNHVHVVFRPLSGFELSGILHSWKSFTAKEANKILKREGTFWQAEPYDHLVRDAQDLAHCARYVLENPRCAGLVGWRWLGSAAEHRRDADATV